MTLWFIAMLLISLIWIGWFFYRPIKINKNNLDNLNTIIAKQKLQELESDLSQGNINKTLFDQAKKDISITLANELEEEKPLIKNSKHSYLSLIFILCFLPIISIGIYKHLSPEIETTPTPTIEQSIEKINQYLISNQNDAYAWHMLAMSYFELGNIDESLNAYEKSYKLDDTNPRLLVEYASTLIMKNNDNFYKKPVELIKQALSLEPDAPDALYLAGMFAISQKDFNLAKILWNKALKNLPDNSIDRQAIDNMLKELDTVYTK